MKMTEKGHEARKKWGGDQENKGREGGRERVSRWEERVGYESGLQHYNSSSTPMSHCCIPILHPLDKMVGNMQKHLATDTCKHTYFTT